MASRYSFTPTDLLPNYRLPPIVPPLTCQTWTATPRPSPAAAWIVLGARHPSAFAPIPGAPGPRPPLPGLKGKPGDWDSYPPGLYKGYEVRPDNFVPFDCDLA
jgi:hypothetical protein